MKGLILEEECNMAAPLVSDELWSRIEPLLPEHHSPGPDGGRPPVDDRAALTGILFVLRTGIPWELLPQEMHCGCGMTCWRRLRDWQASGVWDKLLEVLLSELRGADKIDWSRAAADSSSIRAVGGGEATGPNSTDRARPGTKHHVVVDGQGVPLTERLNWTCNVTAQFRRRVGWRLGPGVFRSYCPGGCSGLSERRWPDGPRLAWMKPTEARVGVWRAGTTFPEL